jgi:hypothetical protein
MEECFAVLVWTPLVTLKQIVAAKREYLCWPYPERELSVTVVYRDLAYPYRALRDRLDMVAVTRPPIRYASLV